MNTPVSEPGASVLTTPSDREVVIERMEVERGGHWRFVEHSPDGVHGFEGRYREVTPPERLAFTFEWDGMPGHVVVARACRPASTRATRRWTGCWRHRDCGWGDRVELSVDHPHSLTLRG
jgi:activator of Hsp90 ATPase-like protein